MVHPGAPKPARPGLDLLRAGDTTASAKDPVERWPGNRIGWSGSADEDVIYYSHDAFGNRVQARYPDGRTLRLDYDALHQLVRVRAQDIDSAQWQDLACYRYDAFGRRLAKSVPTAKASEQETTYFGWDGDRLVHTEDRNGIRHTVYEPDTFIPLLQLERSQATPTAADTLMGLGQSQNAKDSMPAMPRSQRQGMEAALGMALNPTTHTHALLAQMHLSPEMRELMQSGINELKSAQQQQANSNPLTIRHYLCDHLGTPMALVEGGGNNAGEIS